ncbi:MAG: NAD(P)-binding domain-containing protein [Planctomycetota bacterium]|nr:NAD(P)-binding domain-containing protein [Planctomycetota bacterium]
MSDGKRILVADKFPDSGLKRLKSRGLEVKYEPDLAPEKLPGLLEGVAVLVVRSTKVKAEAIAAGKDLQLIVRAGAGTDNIDTAKASTLGIYVANCPGRNAAAVAELALGLLLAADRRIPQATADLKAGTWNKKEYGKADGIKGRTLGVLGLGGIGQLVIERAQAFGMKIVAWSRSLTPERAEELGVRYAATPLDVARAADAVTLHVAYGKETHHLVGEAFLAAMKPRAILVNTSRGAVVDEAALRKAIAEKGIRPALDVFEAEPAAAAGPVDLAVAKEASFVGTPHIGASTEQAQEAIAEEAVRIVEAFLATGEVPNCVNLAERTPARYLLAVRHYDRVGVLAGIFDELRGGGINVQRTSNIVFLGAEAAVARIELDSEPQPATLAKLRAQEHVLSVELVPL